MAVATAKWVIAAVNLHTHLQDDANPVKFKYDATIQEANETRAKWVRHNTTLSPAVIAERRRHLFLGMSW